MAFCAVHRFRDQESRYPENREEDIAKVVQLAKDLNAENKAAALISVDEIDTTICSNVAAFSKCSITSQAAMFGGFVAQEIVKYTGKYTPLKQWAHYDCFESLPTENVNREPLNCRYDD